MGCPYEDGTVLISVRALQAGAVDFLQKPAPPKELLKRVRSALELDRQTRAISAEDATVTERLARLTPREREVMQLLLAEKTSREIATTLRGASAPSRASGAEVLSKAQVASAAQLVRVVLSMRNATSRA